MKLLLFVACLQQLCGHLLKFKMYFGSIFPSRGRCGTFVVSGYLPHVTSQIALGGQELHPLPDSSNYSSFSKSYLMEIKEFILKYKLGHSPSRARVPPGDSA